MTAKKIINDYYKKRKGGNFIIKLNELLDDIIKASISHHGGKKSKKGKKNKIKKLIKKIPKEYKLKL